MNATIYVLSALVSALAMSTIYMAVSFVRAKGAAKYWESLFLDARKTRNFWMGRCESSRQECAKLRKGLARKHRRIGFMLEDRAKLIAARADAEELQPRSDAWYAVCDALDSIAPGWMNSNDVSAREAAVRTIRALGPKAASFSKALAHLPL